MVVDVAGRRADQLQPELFLPGLRHQHGGGGAAEAFPSTTRSAPARSCAGLGYKMEFDEDLMIPDKTVSIADGAITVMGWQSCTDKSSYTRAVLDALAEEYDFSLWPPRFSDYPKKIHDILIYGTERKDPSRCITAVSAASVCTMWPLRG